MREVARRLERLGPTLLVTESEEEVQIARGTCSFVLTLEEWTEKLRKSEKLEGVMNIVTSCKNCPTVFGLKGRFWTFLPDSISELTSSYDERNAVYTLRQEVQCHEISLSSLSQTDLIERVTKLHLDVQIKDKENRQLKEKVASLEQESNNRILETASLGPHSQDSGIGSDISSLYSQRTDTGFDTDSVASYRNKLNPRSVSQVHEAMGEHNKDIGLVKFFKRHVHVRKSKTKGLDDVKEESSDIKEVPIYVYTLTNEDSTAHYLLQCRQQEMSKDCMNTGWCHLTEDGHLMNSASLSPDHHGHKHNMIHNGTCGTHAIPLPSISLPAEVPLAHYWEIETEVDVNATLQMEEMLPILVVGVVEERQLNSEMWVYGNPHMWCVRVGVCHTHHPGICMQFYSQENYVKCYKDTIYNTPGTSKRLTFGVLVDTARSVSFIDPDRNVLLHRMDVAFQDVLYPVFGLYPVHKEAAVTMRLISGPDIQMPRDKQKLIYNCLTSAT